MPGRKHKFIIDGIYHVYNKTIEKRKLFDNKDICSKFIEIIQYYRSANSILRFSKYQKLTSEFKQYYKNKILDLNSFRVEILAFCLMPTHYHLLLKQKQQKGISIVISQIQNSLTRYYNVKTEKNGPIFLHRFKSKPISNEKELKHTSRYIHLNPYSSGVIQDIEELEHYPWSSLHEYLADSSTSLAQPEYILSTFNNDKNRYRKFILENAEYQKTLEYCKYLKKW